MLYKNNRFKTCIIHHIHSHIANIPTIYLEYKCNLKVMGLTGDGATQNRRLFKMHDSICLEEDKNSEVDVCYRVRNVFRPNLFIFFISNPPHLLKTLRNSLSSSKDGSSVRYVE